MKTKEMITITLDEYKELLEIKGRYLEKGSIIYIPSYPQYPTIYPSYYTCTSNIMDSSTYMK